MLGGWTIVKVLLTSYSKSVCTVCFKWPFCLSFIISLTERLKVRRTTLLASITIVGKQIEFQLLFVVGKRQDSEWDGLLNQGQQQEEEDGGHRQHREPELQVETLIWILKVWLCKVLNERPPYASVMTLVLS